MKYDVPFTSELLEQYAEHIKTRCKSVETGPIGESVLGRRILFFKAGTGAKKLFINAAHHANEWLTAPVVARFFDEFVRGAKNGERFAGVSGEELLKSVSLYIVPLVNPDGVDLVNGALDEEFVFFARGIAEAHPAVPFPKGWKANIEGVDLNLCYDAGWKSAVEIKARAGVSGPSPRDWPGLAPFSAPESRALRDFTVSNAFDLTLSYHSQGEVIYWNSGEKAPALSERFARRLAAASGYAAEDTPFESSFAGYRDWFCERFGKPGFTVEAGLGESPLPLEDFEKIYAVNKKLMVEAVILCYTYC